MSGKKDNTDQSLLVYLPDLLEGIDASILTEFLKDGDPVSPEILDGFRVTKKTVRSPVLRQRLIKLAEKDPEFLETLGVLWVDSNKGLWSRIALGGLKELQGSLTDLAAEYGIPDLRISLLLDDRLTVNRLTSKLSGIVVPPAPEQPAPTHSPVIQNESSGERERLRDANKKLREKARDLEKQLRASERRADEKENSIERAKFDAISQKRLIAEQKQQLQRNEKLIDRMRRANEAAEEANSQIERELKDARKKIDSLAAVATHGVTWGSSNKMRGPDWVPTISAMLKKREYEAAKVFCETLREMDPDSLHAHLALEHVYAKTEARAAQVDECLWIAGYLKKMGQPTRACAFACRALEVKPQNSTVQDTLRQLLREINVSDESAISAVRGLIRRLKSSRPTAYKEAFAIIQSMDKRFARMFEEKPSVLHIDKIIPLDNGNRMDQLSIRRIIEAVDGNDVEVVDFVRQALANLRKEKPSQWRQIMESLTAMDNSCVQAIMRGNQPVVVDGSNVAWHEMEGKPRLKNILDLRNELRADGYFPVYIYVDAALPYQVDKRSALLQLIENGAVVAVDGHTDADETILDQARRIACPVVTNDRMADWDPNGEIPKFRFSIDQFGITVYDR